ncbi:uncharacterized protein K489DRAFT_177867 [Dissoconium aciculare CBS 342.82]|uniref:Uncharacterized protein n=1 Tax=Dissoconium aciculare CBS 342.82 TaxID=1314786 RepID=A0A6J3M8C1_9PEZI|nr:uncharacterized protein K489DRAFT_177867 [Dissoconium aciculare CBS 342.82]KAF1824240.1 hypothetical protein K489DRAFT_177867 [Dissoconium aciculare CBS 342.82]
MLESFVGLVRRRTLCDDGISATNHDERWSVSGGIQPFPGCQRCSAASTVTIACATGYRPSAVFPERRLPEHVRRSTPTIWWSTMCRWHSPCSSTEIPQSFRPSRPISLHYMLTVSYILGHHSWHFLAEIWIT